MASTLKTDHKDVDMNDIDMNDINNDYKLVFNKLVQNIDSHKGVISKQLVKKWINQFDEEFSDQIINKRAKNMGNRSSKSSTKINDNLFTTDLSPIRNHFNDNQDEDDSVNDNPREDNSDSDLNTDGQQINESLNGLTLEKTSVLVNNDNEVNPVIDHNIDIQHIEVESDSIEIVENIDNNMDYIDFLTDDNNEHNNDHNNEHNNEVNTRDNNEDNNEKTNQESDESNDCVNNELINSDNYIKDNSKALEEKTEEISLKTSLIENNVDNEVDTYEEEVSQLSDSQMAEVSDCEANNVNNEDKDLNENESKDSKDEEICLRPRNDKNSDKTSSKSSDVEFNDSSDSPPSDSSDDEDFGLENKRAPNEMSRYSRAANDRRLQLEASVHLIAVSDEMVNDSYDDASTVCSHIDQMERSLFESLRSKGFICRKKAHRNKSESKEDNNEDSDEQEFKRLCRIPKLNIAINQKRKKERIERMKRKKEEKDNSGESDSEKPPKTKKIKSNNSTGDESDRELDLDLDSVNSVHIDSDHKLKADKPSILALNSKTVDILDSDVSSDSEECNKDHKKDKPKNNIGKRESKNSESETDVKDVKDVKPETNKNKNIDKVLRKANSVLKEDKIEIKEDKNENKEDKNESKEDKNESKEDKNESKSVIDIDSNSDEEIVLKKRVTKRRLSDDSYNEEEKESDEESESIIEESSGMDPSAPDSDSDLDTKTKKSKNKKPSKQKSSKSSKGKSRKRVVTQDSSDEDEDDVKILSGDDSDSPNKSRKHIKKIISDKKLKQQTKDAAEAERDRRKRIAEKQKSYNELLKSRGLKSTELNQVILEFDKETHEVYVEVDPILVKFLKPHQVDGIKFMYDCIVESLDQLDNSSGSGCILAHSMGLGKTLQVITFLHTILSHETINKHIKTALVICPVNTIKNWANEFRIWLNDHDLDNILVFEMNDAKTLPQRGELMRIWKKRGGVLIMGLTLFSSMVQGGRGKKPSKSVRESIETCLLDPGPDVVICDEGHLLKNEKTAYNKAVSKLKTLRRAVLTGTPLQNNLIEYHVMVHFVKPNLLGTKKEFTNRFVNPITNGQHVDSTDYDVKIMKKRVHILHTLLNGCVHRCDYGVLVPYLQPKHEYVISVKLTDTQIDLYSYYLSNLTDKQRFNLLADYGVLRLVWNHPSLLYEQHRRKMDKAAEDSMDEFIDDDDDVDTPVSGDSDIECVDDNKPSTSKYRRRIRTRYGRHDSEEDKEEALATNGNELPTESDFSNAWFAKYMKEEESKQIQLSGKFILLFSILEECEKVGDKILLFTQSLDTLDLVEELLKQKSEEARDKRMKEEIIDLEETTNTWLKNVDYFRLDGSTGSDYRKAWIDIFNDENNYRARLFLLSTKAGGLGINLVGANRCIIFDASWNPTHDVQAIFRVFRFGQKKPVYVYRFVAQGTMEEKIYERQIIKQSLSCRVIDEQQIQRHFKASELSELYVFNPDKSKERPTPVLPKDRLLAELLIKHKEYIVNYHEHDSLLENKPEEDMTEEEKQQAWNEYENEKDGAFLREQQEEQMRRQREYLLAQQQAQQQYQQQQQQQYAQQLYQYQQQFMSNSASSFGNQQNNFQSLLQNQILQNILKSQANIRKQHQQLLRQQQQPTPAHQPKTPNGGLPGYDVLTVEDIAQYLKSLNANIDAKSLVERIFHIINTGINTCTKELTDLKLKMSVQPSPDVSTKYTKVAKEVYNLNLQQSRANAMFKNANVRSGPNILRPNSYQSQPTVIEPEDFTQQSSTSSKPSSVLIEEVD